MLAQRRFEDHGDAALGAARAVFGGDAQLGHGGELGGEREVGDRARAVERERQPRGIARRQLAREEEQRRHADAAGGEDGAAIARGGGGALRVEVAQGRPSGASSSKISPLEALAMRRVPCPTTLIKIDGRSPAVSRLIGRGSSGSLPQVVERIIANWPGSAAIGSGVAKVSTW